MPKIGDHVRFLNSTGGGTIVKIKDNIAYVADEDGFETPVLLREIVVVATAESEPRKTPANTLPVDLKPTTSNKTPKVAVPETPEDEEIIETPEGNKINLVLAYEPENVKQISTTNFNAYLVNDSNFFLYFTYMTHSDQAEGWKTRYAGIVEPNIQLLIDEIERDSICEMDRIAIQYIAFKRDKEFELKQPVSVEQRLDNSKFFKLHCFRDNIYFDNPVIAIDIVKNDVVSHPAPVDVVKIEEAIKEKMRVDRPKRRQVTKRKEKRQSDIIEVDLHITELVDSIRGLSNADMLNLQVDEFRRIMDSNLKNHGQKIVFIHGKGEGVLRQAIMKELNYRYKGHEVHDASFREYGYGATQVTIK